jgi:hypothetical protein
VIADRGAVNVARLVLVRLKRFRASLNCPGDLPRPIRVAHGNLIGVVSPQNFDRSLEQDREIESETPVVDVPKVIFDASFD